MPIGCTAHHQDPAVNPVAKTYFNIGRFMPTQKSQTVSQSQTVSLGAGAARQTGKGPARLAEPKGRDVNAAAAQGKPQSTPVRRYAMTRDPAKVRRLGQGQPMPPTSRPRSSRSSNAPSRMAIRASRTAQAASALRHRSTIE